ncbi:electron transfer flavoprotein subunit beta/FixA family protein [Caballeronia sp. GAWG2-1]|uniref:electron transfer flavoprotein subunit beta/FixA family protein n=1 Tax=Caballeronia sp. GAWG2-1 TaxID=2921744 RepID=UPI00202871D7|nr:electron transfer flavoprotein subunit beta/FixA family protein [Caballeronia sp. GAWG2-1]
MKVLVAVKRVVDANVHVRVKSDGSGVDIANAKMAINPFDEVAVEQAVRMREQGRATEVVAVTIGPDKAAETVRVALAMGADRGIHLKTDARLEPLAVAKLLKAIAEQEQPHLVLLGKQAIDSDCHQTGQMLAGLLGWPQLCAVSAMQLQASNLSVQRETDAGVQTLESGLPAVVTVDLRLNDPRHASLPDIIKAKKKPIHVSTPEELGIDTRARLVEVSFFAPHQRSAGTRVTSLPELASAIETALQESN